MIGGWEPCERGHACRLEAMFASARSGVGPQKATEPCSAPFPERCATTLGRGPRVAMSQGSRNCARLLASCSPLLCWDHPAWKGERVLTCSTAISMVAKHSRSNMGRCNLSGGWPCREAAFHGLNDEGQLARQKKKTSRVHAALAECIRVCTFGTLSSTMSVP